MYTINNGHVHFFRLECNITLVYLHFSGARGYDIELCPYEDNKYIKVSHTIVSPKRYFNTKKLYKAKL